MQLTRWALMCCFLSICASRYQVIDIFKGLNLEKAISCRCLSVSITCVVLKVGSMSMSSCILNAFIKVPVSVGLIYQGTTQYFFL